MAFLLALPSLVRAETGYGKLFYGIPLSSSVDEVEKLLAAREGFKVSTSSKADGTTSVRGNFDAGTVEVRFRNGKIVLIQHKAGPYPLKTVRGVDTYFVKQLGPVALLKLDKAEHYFSKNDFDGCLKQCASKCGEHAPSPYFCDAGKVCQGSCLTQTLPSDPANLQQYLFERTPQEGAQYSSYWPCESRAKATRVALEAPAAGCYMRLRVGDCIGGGVPDKTGCVYDMLYRNE
ncbi:MAG: hypothetical protein R3D51_03470 [Hyphomicrobiaceae bacterium]